MADDRNCLLCCQRAASGRAMPTIEKEKVQYNDKEENQGESVYYAFSGGFS